MALETVWTFRTPRYHAHRTNY